MSPWQEFIFAVLLSFACFTFAYSVKAMRVVWLACGVAVVASSWIFAEQLSRQSNGFLLAAGVPMLTGPLFRFPLTATLRIGLGFATILVVTWSGWLDLLSPALCRSELRRVQTWMTEEGVCMQQTPYTCGPASAVTLLRSLGLRAEEGELALLARSSSHAGKAPDELAAAIRQRFASEGIHVDAKSLGTFDELCHSLPVLTVVQMGPVLDHWVAVLGITETSVRFADPVRGMREETPATFMKYWEHETVRVWRDAPLRPVHAK